MKLQVVFILSTNYAGSHLLALQLGSHTQCISVGEFHQFKYGAGKRVSKRCVQCPSDEACPLFQGIAGAPVSQIYQRLASNIHKNYEQVNTVIDNSKHPRWVRRLLDTEDFECKFVHLLRDPRALVRRWMLFFDSERRRRTARGRTARRCWRHAWSILTGSETNVYLWKWWHRNKAITDLIRRHRLDARLVTYSDLVLDPDRTLGQLMAWLGHAYEPAQKAYWEFSHHGSIKPQYMHPPKGGQFAFDQRWQEFLDADAKQEVLDHVPVHRYLESIGLHIDGDRGLTAMSPL